MIRINNLRLGQRLFLSVALMAAALVFIILLGFHISEQAVNRMNGFYDQANSKTVAGVALGKAYSQDLVSLVNKINQGSYPWSVGQDRLDQIQSEIRSNLLILRLPPTDQDENELIRGIGEQVEAGDLFIKRLRSVLARRDKEGLKDLSLKMYPCVDPIGFRVDLFLDYELGRTRQLVEANHDSFQESYGGLALATLAGVLALFFLVAAHLRRRVSKPLKQLVQGMRDITEGNGDLTRRLEETGKDEIGQVADAFNIFIGKLQTVTEMKQDLISVVSHQLKTPVAEINGYIENLLEGLAGEIKPKQRQYLEDMREIGWDNYRLICDLLSVSKLERGVVTVDLKPVPARRLVELAIRDYEKLIDRKGLSLFLEDGGQELWVNADQDKTVETLRNIINNAVKCTDKGSISIRWGSEGDSGLLEVQDTGIGMTPETLGRLFSKGRVFGQEAHRAGAGLGLFIGKKFMNLQKGDIRVKSEPGRGTCFTLVIPKCREEHKGAA